MRCAACRRDFESDHVENDHRIPRSIGGDNSARNKQYLCIACHHRKTALEVKLFQFYAESEEISEWFKLAFQGETKRMEEWVAELGMKVLHFKEVLRALQGE